jgi:ferredoxin-thioredoxin reductase catalytic subunit
MDAKELFSRLGPIQEAKGFYFNPDMDMTMPLLQSLLDNRDRYGYMACPCRLASGGFDADRDIICPCVYRDPDVEEFGSCYCGLYVSKAWIDGTVPHKTIPERRPPEKLLAALGVDD